jgi:hypothetical protein
MAANECLECTELLKTAEKAAIDHIKVESKAKIAMLQHDPTAVSALMASVEKLASNRQQAMADYRTHRTRHDSGLKQPTEPTQAGSLSRFALDRPIFAARRSR